MTKNRGGWDTQTYRKKDDNAKGWYLIANTIKMISQEIRDEIGFLLRHSREEHNYGCHEKKLRKSFGELQQMMMIIDISNIRVDL